MKFYSLESIRSFPPETVTHLSMHKRHLRTVPAPIRDLVNLVELDLSGNDLEDLPDWLAELPALKRLLLRDNNFRHFPGILADLPTLEMLDFSGNACSKLPADSGFARLSILIFDKNDLCTFPETEGESVALRRLSLAGNCLKKIPDTLARCRHLRDLSLAENRLRAIPDALFNLPNLEILDLSGNQITQIADRANAWPALTNLNLARNKIAHLPDSFRACKALRKLSLSGNQFSDFPAVLASLTGLRQLDFSRNKLRTWPSQTDQFPPLETLFLAQNKIADISPNPASWHTLRQLSLARNRLHSLPAALFSLDRLRRLDNFNGIKGAAFIRFLAHCRLSEIEPAHRPAFFEALFLKKTENLSRLPLAVLFRGLRFRSKNIRDCCREIILTQTATSPIPDSVKRLLITGKTHTLKTRLKARATRLGWEILNEPDSLPALVILGDFPPDDLCGHKNLFFIEEKTFLDQLEKAEQPWLLEDHRAAARQKLSDLLLSGQNENIALALQIMATGGVPPDLHTDLFIARRKTTRPDLRRAIGRLTALHFSEKEKAAIRWLAHTFGALPDPDQLRERTAGTPLDAEKIIRHLSPNADKKTL